MSKNKLNLTITKAHGDMWQVEMRDHHSNYTCVYEPSVKQALDYASKWCEQAEQRKQENQAHAKAVMEMNKLDKKAGILTGNSDGLD